MCHVFSSTRVLVVVRPAVRARGRRARNDQTASGSRACQRHAVEVPELSALPFKALRMTSIALRSEARVGSLACRRSRRRRTKHTGHVGWDQPVPYAGEGWEDEDLAVSRGLAWSIGETCEERADGDEVATAEELFAEVEKGRGDEIGTYRYWAHSTPDQAIVVGGGQNPGYSVIRSNDPISTRVEATSRIVAKVNTTAWKVSDRLRHTTVQRIAGSSRKRRATPTLAAALVQAAANRIGDHGYWCV